MSNLAYAYFTASLDQAESIVANGLQSVCVEMNVNGVPGLYDGVFLTSELSWAAEALTDERPVLVRFSLGAVAEIFDVIKLEQDFDGSDQFGAALDKFTVPVKTLEFSEDQESGFRPMTSFVIMDTNDNGFGVEIEHLGSCEEDIPGTEDVSGPEAAEEAVGAVAPESDAEAPVKKVYDTPYLPRGQWFKKMREQGLLAPRQPRAKKTAAPKSETSKSVRSPAQLAAIRGYYARKRQAATA